MRLRNESDSFYETQMSILIAYIQCVPSTPKLMCVHIFMDSYSTIAGFLSVEYKMSHLKEVLCACAALFIIASKSKKTKKRSIWVRQYFEKRIATQAIYNELQIDDLTLFSNFFRMTPSDFEIILNLVAPHIEKNVTNYRHPIPTFFI